MKRPTVQDKTEITANVATFWGLSGRCRTPSLTEKAAKMLPKAHNLVGVDFGGDVGVLFAPSRFTGYVGNTIPVHEVDLDKDGGVTDPAISRVCGIKPRPDEALEAQFQVLCRRYSVKPDNRERDYWPIISTREDASPRRRGTAKRPTCTQVIPPKEATEADQLHNRLQEHLYVLLVDTYGEESVVMEESYVDLRVTHSELQALIEVKSDIRPRYAIRQALGQLLDYAFVASYGEDVPTDLVLVIAAPGPLDDESRALLKFIRAKTGFGLRYVQLTESSKKCPL